VKRTVFHSMGCEVVVEGASPPRAAEIRALFERYDETFSRFRASSELARLNESRGGSMSPFFSAVLEVAVWAARETGGLVDPTVGSAVLSAGYDRDFSEGLDCGLPPGPPAPADYRRARRLGPVLALPRGVLLDLNGVVKSLAVDRAAALLDADGFVSAGGDLATRGPVDVALVGAAVRVRGAIATSGTTQRRWSRGGHVQHHLIDPRTGMPSRSCWSQVSVCGATCLAADVAAKAALLLGEDGLAWLDARGLPGRFVSHTGDTIETAPWRSSLGLAACI
jgi:thiamine biosynthesis lipoprotein